MVVAGIVVGVVVGALDSKIPPGGLLLGRSGGGGASVVYRNGMSEDEDEDVTEMELLEDK